MEGMSEKRTPAAVQLMEVDTSCPVSSDAGGEGQEPEPEPEQPKKKSGSGLLAVVALLVLAGGGLRLCEVHQAEPRPA